MTALRQALARYRQRRVAKRFARLIAPFNAEIAERRRKHQETRSAIQARQAFVTACLKGRGA